MKRQFKIYGRKYSEWFYVDTFTTKEGAEQSIGQMLSESNTYRAFAKYVEFEIRETYTWN